MHPCWYIEYLAERDYTAGSISNHLAHIRTFYKLAGLRDAPLNHYRVNLALRAAAMNIRRRAVQKQAVTPAMLKAVVRVLYTQPDPLPITLAILIMFIGFLRQSSLAPPTVSTFDHTRHLTRADARISEQGLVIRLKWSKTLQKSCDLKNILLPPTQDKTICPVETYKAYVAAYPATRQSAPLLSFKDGQPLTTRHIARRWTQAVKQAGLPSAALSLHSLRKGGASFVYNQGRATLNDVMAQGTWRSLSVRDYIKPQEASKTTVHDALSAL